MTGNGVRGKKGPLTHGGSLPAFWFHPVAWGADCTPTPFTVPEGLTSLGSQVVLEKLGSVAPFGVMATAIWTLCGCSRKQNIWLKKEIAVESLGRKQFFIIIQKGPGDWISFFFFSLNECGLNVKGCDLWNKFRKVFWHFFHDFELSSAWSCECPVWAKTDKEERWEAKEWGKKHPQFSTTASAGSQLLRDDKTPAKTRNGGLERAELSCADSGPTLSTQNWLLLCLRMQMENRAGSSATRQAPGLSL